MSQNLKTYQQITSELKAKQRQIHLLLGNGFSMAYNPEIFSYNALHNFISSQDNLKIKSLFDIVKTKNFELVMQQLDNFIDLARVFGCDKNLESDILTMKSISVLDFYLHSYLAMAIYSARTMIYCYIGYYCEKVRFTI